MKRYRIVLCFGLILLRSFVQGQDFSNKGKDFWLCFPTHVPSGNNLAHMSLFLTSDQNSSGTITVGSFSTTFTVTANQVTSGIDIPYSVAHILYTEAGSVVKNKGIHVQVDNGRPAVVLYAHIYAAARSEASLILPTNVLGKKYFSMNYVQNTGSMAGFGSYSSQFQIMAVEANTTVKYQLRKNGVLDNTSTTVTLQDAGDILEIQNTQDLTGSVIESVTSGAGQACKKIAVFSGSSAVNIGLMNGNTTSAGSSTDPLFQQCYPVNTWGKSFGMIPFVNDSRNFHYRVLASEDNTTVKIDNTTVTLNAGQYYPTYPPTGQQTPLAKPFIISADKPIAAAQYMISSNLNNYGNSWGDPEMVLLNPIEQNISDISVFSSTQQVISAQYLNVFGKYAAISSFKINGGAPKGTFVRMAAPYQDYAYLIENLTTYGTTSFRLTCDSGFNAICYGIGNVESYGYSAGTSLHDFTPVATFQNQYKRIDSAVTCVNSPVQFAVPLSFQPTTIKWDFAAAPGVSPNATIGPLTNKAFDSSGAVNGQTVYYYSPGVPFQFSKVNSGGVRDTIKLYTTSSTPDGCGSTDQVYSIPVTVRDAPVAAFQYIHGGCVGDTVMLNDKSTGQGITRRLWDFSDGTTADTTADSYKKLYSSAGSGSYAIKLKVISDIGCASSEQVQTLNLSSKPVAKYTPPATACMNENIFFKDISTIQTGTLARRNWSMDTGTAQLNFAFAADAPAKYTSFGPKDVWLVVTSTTGCMSDTFRISPQFKVNASPEVGFIIPEVCLNDASAQFTDTTKIADGSTNFTYAWNFNAGSPAITPGPNTTTSTLQNPAVKYNKAADYKVSLKVTSNGCSTTLDKDFTVNGANPVSAFEVQKSTGLCSNDSVRIKNKSTVDFGNVTRLEIFWDANDLTRKTVDENPYPDKIYAYLYPDFQSPASKTYSVTLKAYSGNAASCSKSSVQTITVNAAPKVSFVKMPGICFDASARQITEASFDNRVAGGFVYSGTGVNAAGLFNAQTAGVGTFPIKYVYTSNKDCRDSATVSITVWPSPVAKWGVTAPLCQKNDILFSDSSLPNYSNITKRNWNYDDGSAVVTKTSATAYTRQFTIAKTYNISLQVITDSGCKSPLNTQAIKINYLPKPAFSLPSICLPDGNGQFNNQSSIDDGSEALFSYRWNFNDPNDASASTLKDPTHRYTALGPYDVQLKVTSKDGCVDSLTQKLSTIYPQPKASFTATPAEICIGDSISFKDLGNGMGSAAASWYWNLGSGATATSQNPVKKYTDSGAITVSYYFFNAQGCVSDTVSQQVTVYPYPKLDLGPDLKVLEGGVVTIKPKLAYGTGLSYLWSPGTYLDSVTSATPKSTPADDITYVLKLSGKGGCSVTDAIFIQVLKSPEVPNAFSPNGDGINDTWRIKYLESYPGAEIDVYNRYGQVVFHSVGYDVDWDGSYNGRAMPVGTYYYVINPKNNRKIITGAVTIIK